MILWNRISVACVIELERPFLQLKEQQVYARARKFLRQLEIRFQDNPHHLSRILNAFHVVAENGVYNEHEVSGTSRVVNKNEIEKHHMHSQTK